MKIISHRGDVSLAPENTMPAFSAAINSGANAVELDIRLTKDGKVLVAHDAGFARVMCGLADKKERRLISQMSLEEACKVKMPYAGHLNSYFPKGGYEDESLFYLPWCLDSEQNVINCAKQAVESVKNTNNHDEISECIFNNFEALYNEKYKELLNGDLRYATYPSLEEFLLWLKNEERCEFAEIEFKDLGLIKEVDRLINKLEVSGKCILFSGVKKINEEIQAYYKDNKKPDNLRLGANIRYVNADTLKMIEHWDLYEVGLNAGALSKDDIYILKNMGIEVFLNLGDTAKWWKEMKSFDILGFKTNCIKKYLAC